MEMKISGITRHYWDGQRAAPMLVCVMVWWSKRMRRGANPLRLSSYKQRTLTALCGRVSATCVLSQQPLVSSEAHWAEARHGPLWDDKRPDGVVMVLFSVCWRVQSDTTGRPKQSGQRRGNWSFTMIVTFVGAMEAMVMFLLELMGRCSQYFCLRRVKLKMASLHPSRWVKQTSWTPFRGCGVVWWDVLL